MSDRPKLTNSERWLDEVLRQIAEMDRRARANTGKSDFVKPVAN